METMLRGIDQLLFPVCALGLIFVGVTVDASSCPAGQVERTVNPQNNTICCVPYFNCDKDHEIVSCTGGENNKDTCVPCQNGQVNRHVTSSLEDSWTKNRCFEKILSHEHCSPDDTIPIAEDLFKNCALPCECDISKCFYDNPCGCKKGEICKKGQELNTATGKCQPCREHTYKTVTGCQPCSWNETSWRLAQMGGVPTLKVSTDNKVAEDKGVTLKPGGVMTTGAKYVIETGDGEPVTSKTTDNETSDKGGAPVALIIVIMLFLVLAAVGIALFLVMKRRIKNGDQTSRLVICYNKLACKKGNQVPNEDNAEAGQAADGGDTVEPQSRPQQVVAPIIQEKPGDNEDEETIPFAEMSLNVRVTDEQNDSCTPLMPSETNGEANADSTEQKTP